MDKKIIYGERFDAKQDFIRVIDKQLQALQYVLDSYNSIEGQESCKTIQELDLLIRDRDIVRKRLSKALSEKLGVSLSSANDMLVLPNGYSTFMESISHYKRQKINESYVFNFQVKGAKIVKVQKSLDAVLDTMNLYSAEVDKVKAFQLLENLCNTELKPYIDDNYGRLDFPFLNRVREGELLCYRIKPSLRP